MNLSPTTHDSRLTTHVADPTSLLTADQVLDMLIPAGGRRPNPRRVHEWSRGGVASRLLHGAPIVLRSVATPSGSRAWTRADVLAFQRALTADAEAALGRGTTARVLEDCSDAQRDAGFRRCGPDKLGALPVVFPRSGARTTHDSPLSRLTTHAGSPPSSSRATRQLGDGHQSGRLAAPPPVSARLSSPAASA